MRMNPTSQSWTQISMDSSEGYAGRCFETSFVLAHANWFWPMPIGLCIWQIVKLAQNLIILTLATIHNLFWWLIDRKQCNQFQLFCCLIIHLISGWFANWFASWFFVGLLIGSSNWITRLIQTWVPATELRFVNAFAWLAKRMSANSTKNFKKGGIAFNSFLFIAVQIKILNAVSFRFARVT